MYHGIPGLLLLSLLLHGGWRAGCYQRLSGHPWKTGLIILDKSTVSQPLIGKTDILYNYSILYFMFWSILNYNPAHDLNIKIDRRIGRRRRDHFNHYGASKADFIWKKMNKQGRSIINKINIEHDHSHNDHCLQFADFLLSRTFQLYEKGKCQYFREFKNNISRISYLFRTKWICVPVLLAPTRFNPASQPRTGLKRT